MADTKKLEMALECLLNEEDGKAGELLHEFFVQTARNILEDIESDEDMEGDFADETSGEEMFSDDELDGEDDMEADPALDIDPENETVEERLMDLEDALEELQAEFASLGGESDEDFGDEMDTEEEDDGESNPFGDDEEENDVEDDTDELEAEEMNEAVSLVAVPKVKPVEGQGIGSNSTAGGATTVNNRSTSLANSGKKGVDGKTQTLAAKSSTPVIKDTTSNTGAPTSKGKGVPAGTSDVHNRVNGKSEKAYSNEKRQAIRKDTSGDKGDTSAKSLVSGKKIR